MDMKQMYTALQTVCPAIKTVGQKSSQGPSPTAEGEQCHNMAETPSTLDIKK